MTYAPYTFVQQPNLESKTVLRKKFAWKHYPEVRWVSAVFSWTAMFNKGRSMRFAFDPYAQLERFLIENRDDYLEHSSRNYTIAQKQFNNHLTEELLKVAEKHNYVFDPDEFNFVAIRDRIRCYYKSYVQTIRKRGLPLPGSLKKKKKQIQIITSFQ